MRHATGVALALLSVFCTAAAGADALRFDFSRPFLADRLREIEKGRPTLSVARCQAPPKVDGLIDPAEWDSAPEAKFHIPSTRVRLMFDDAALYIAAECDMPGAPPAQHASRPRDTSGMWKEDCLEIWIAPSPKADLVYQFVVNVKGAVYDGIRKQSNDDASYDPEWTSAVGRTATGWTVEMAIPRTAVRADSWPAKLGFDIGRNGPVVSTRSWTGAYGNVGGQLLLEGVTEQPDPTADESISTRADGALSLGIRCASARPQDRWIEASLKVQPPGGLARTRITAAVFGIAEDKPMAEASATPARTDGKLLVDLRSLGLTQARLRVLFAEGEKVLGRSEAFLSARAPEAPLVPGQRIPVAIDLPSEVEPVESWPVTFGVPFAAGVLWDADALSLVDDRGRKVPSQKEVTGLWAKEGSIQWVRFDALVSSQRKYHVEVAATGPDVNPATPLVLTEKGDKVELATGLARYVLGKGPSPIEEVWLGASRVAASRGTRGLYVVDQNGAPASASADGETMEIESRGPVAACVRFEGFYVTKNGEPLAKHITRVEAFAGRPFARITHTLILTNDTNKVWFKDIGWEFAVEPGANPSAVFNISREDWRKSVAQPLSPQVPTAYLFQDRHFALGHGANHWSMCKLDAGNQPATVLEGEECGDWFMLSGENGGLAFGCREAARQHPKEFEATRDRIVLHLFSGRGGEQLDFRAPALVKRWGLEEAGMPKPTVEVEAIKGYMSNAIGWAKTHALLILPVGRGKTPDSVAETSRLHTRPVYATPAPEWTYHTEVFGRLHPRDARRFPEAEKFIEDTFRLWEKRNDDWGDYGFVDYFTGPHQQYAGKNATFYRYSPLWTYTLRGDLWKLYARSGDRDIRAYAEATTRTFGDSVIAHWPGRGKAKGLFLCAGGGRMELPFYWEGSPMMSLESTSDMIIFLSLYHLAGDRRGRDIVLGYAEGIKSFWTPKRIKRDFRSIMALRMILQAYGLTWDPALRELAEATTDVFTDAEGAIGLSKDRAYNSSTYKIRTDIAGLLDAWRILGDRRYYDLSLGVAKYLWEDLLGLRPVFYVNNLGLVGQFLYAASGGDPAYAEMLAFQMRAAAAGYRDGELIPTGAEQSTFIFQGIPYAQDLAFRTGADRSCLASWVAYDDFGFPTSIAVKKADQGSLEVDVRSEDVLHYGSVEPGVRLRALQAGGLAGMDLNSVWNRSGYWCPFGKVRVPKDAPEGAYEILPPGEGSIFAIAHGKPPMVLHAPGYWQPVPQSPAVRWHFSVPKDSSEAQIFFEGETRLYDPQGKPWPEDKTLRGWVDLSADKPGIWSFEPVDHKLVRVRNIPPFFAARDAANYFIPPIPWQREKVPPPPEKLPDATRFMPGALETPGNQAVHLTERHWLRIDGGAPHPSGDGLQFLPFKQGTIEFFLKPDWSTFDLPDKAWKNLVTLEDAEPGDHWYLAYQKDRGATHWHGSHVLAAYFPTEGPAERSSMRSRRQTILSNEAWVHVAWVWGTRQAAGFTSRQGVRAITTRLFVNGKVGRRTTYSGERWKDAEPINMPKVLAIMDSVDELRISDVQRYWEDFTPPARDREFQVDKNTRALFHFNGHLDGESFGHTGPVPAQVK